MLQTDLLQNIRYGVTDGRSGRQRQVDNTKGNAQTTGSFLCNQLSDTSDLEGSLFDGFTENLKVLTAHLLKCIFYYTGTTDTYVDDSVCFCHAMESACHKGVIIGSITKYHQFGTAQRILFLCGFCRSFYHLAHQTNCVHIDAGLCRTHIDRTADTFRAGQCLRNRTNQKLIRLCHSFGNQCGISAQEIDTHFLGCLVQCFCQLDKIIRCLAGCAAHQSRRSDGNTLVYDRDTVLCGDILARFHQIFGQRSNLGIHFFADHINIRIDTIQKTDTHGNGTHIQVLLVNHFICFVYLKNINHAVPPIRCGACW